ncbi:UDP-4-amino-4,6-dideoxy-N-acetyl-beta-L-altrosamine transaminase [Chitinivibrio alkaliphilus]|uniref:UDP-4-keto-6-deoxy-N-acetylglucosamine 4-aminotransferase n=1 Tax=Chitinivibrio alkaliphilus ACht1 TaxID=1313304 RepID=U7D9E9_9BACT|nr:UDP-4-keto-6-deoxy-N-acetylglucosamine 4-aminotransferase [Chitinivibrio alkaliphilus ACht1]
MKILPYGKHEITPDDITAVSEVLRSDFLTQGPQVEAFEKAFAEYVQAPYAVAVCNATAALHLAYTVGNTRPNTRALTTPLTFAASANAARYCGATVDFVDIDPDTLCIDLAQAEERICSAPQGTYSALTVVDLAGYPVQTEQLYNECRRRNIFLIEDACHAPGAFFHTAQEERIYSGSCRFSDTAVFSFHPVKHIAAGEGGMITTARKDIYDKLCLLRTHGITKKSHALQEHHGPWYYEMHELGYNYRLSDIHAALGRSQLNRAVQALKQRRTLAQRYTKAFTQNDIIIPPANTTHGHAFHLYPIRLKNRDEVYAALRKKGIYAQVHYIPLHLMPYYKRFGFKRGMFPHCEQYYAECLSLPLYPSLTAEEQDYVIEQVCTYARS